MTKHYHTPLSRRDEASILIFNQRFSQLDSAIVDFANELGNRVDATAGENIADRDAIYLDLSDNKIYRMDSNASGPLAGTIRGFAVAAALEDATVTMAIYGILDGFSSLTPWESVYVGTTLGTITQTRPEPTLGGSQIFVADMGFAVATDTIFIKPLPIHYLLRDAMADDDTLTILHHSDEHAYQRKLLAYFTEIEVGASLTSYASSNQDSEAYVQGPTTGAGGTLTITAGNVSFRIGDTGGVEQWLAQSFLIVNTGVLDEITVELDPNAGSPTGNITWEIQSDSASLPSGTILATGTFTPVANSTNTIAVTGGNRIFLSATTYWLVLHAPAQANDTGYTWQGSLSSTYANGISASSTNSGVNWSSNTRDLQMSVRTAAVAGGEKLAQGFQLGGAGSVGIADLWLRKVGSPSGNLTAKIYSNSGGNPDTLLGTSATVAASSLSTSYGTISFTFASPVSLSGSTQYHLVLETSDSQSDSDYVVWGADGSAPSYANGEMKSYNSSAWGALSKDAVFELLEATVYHHQKLKVDRWSGANADMVNRYGDAAGADADTQTTFKCTKAAGFDDVTVIVVID